MVEIDATTNNAVYARTRARGVILTPPLNVFCRGLLTVARSVVMMGVDMDEDLNLEKGHATMCYNVVDMQRSKQALP
jgi:hypothetical protein